MFDDAKVKERAQALPMFTAPRPIGADRNAAHVAVVVRYGEAYVEPRALRIHEHADAGRAAFAALCTADTCPLCSQRHVILKAAPRGLPCLACVKRLEREHAPELPGV